MAKENNEKKAMSKSTKTGITLGIIFVLLIAILTSSLVFLNANQNKTYSKLVIACMPKNITGNDNGKKIDFYIEYNKDYNPKTDEPLKAYQTYYFKDDGTRVNLVNGFYKSPTAEMQVLIGFFYKAQEKITSLKNVVYVLMAMTFIVGLALIIVLWYKSWCKRQAKKKSFYLRDFKSDEE